MESSYIPKDLIEHMQYRQVRIAYSLKKILAYVPRTLKNVLVGDVGQQ